MGRASRRKNMNYPIFHVAYEFYKYHSLIDTYNDYRWVRLADRDVVEDQSRIPRLVITRLLN